MATEKEVFEARVILRRAARYAPADLAQAREMIPPDEEPIVSVGTGYAFQKVYSNEAICALAAEVDRRVEARGEVLPRLREEL